MDYFLRGLMIGFSIAAPVGPIGVLCIRRTLAHGRASGLISGLGAAVADACYGSIAAFGLTFVTSLLVAQGDWLRLIGGAFLCYLGVKTFLEKPASLEEFNLSTTSDLHAGIGLKGSFVRSRADQARARLADFASTFLLTLTNPMTIISFTAIFAGLGVADSGGSASTALKIILGVFSGSALWWLILSTAADVLRARFLQPAGLRWVNWISGLIITAFGLAALYSYLLRIG
jgi:threonine/homoserine/homoserine lactone efflux protein